MVIVWELNVLYNLPKWSQNYVYHWIQLKLRLAHIKPELKWELYSEFASKEIIESEIIQNLYEELSSKLKENAHMQTPVNLELICLDLEWDMIYN